MAPHELEDANRPHRYDRAIATDSSAADRSLPTFRNPPVAEVALAVQWESPRLDALHIAAFGVAVKGEYPLREEQMARPPMQEEFGIPDRPGPFQLEIVQQPPSPRFWFLSKDGSHLIQLQSDFLAVNWRRTLGGTDYPRYPRLRDTAETSLRRIEEILRDEGVEPLKPNWCEVTYINHIEPLPGEAGERAPLDRILITIAPPPAVLPGPEDTQLIQRFRVAEADRPIGRVHLTAVPAFRTEDSTPIYALTLTSRLRPNDATANSALEALDRGRELLDHAFVEMTTAEMHAIWELDDHERSTS